MKYPRVRDVLNWLKWGEATPGLSGVVLIVKDRTMESGTKEVRGAAVTALGPRYFEVGDPSGNSGPPTMIPYYKVVKIVSADGRAIWERPDA